MKRTVVFCNYQLVNYERKKKKERERVRERERIMREREKKKKKIWRYYMYYMYIKDSSKDLRGLGDLCQFQTKLISLKRRAL